MIDLASSRGVLDWVHRFAGMDMDMVDIVDMVDMVDMVGMVDMVDLVDMVIIKEKQAEAEEQMDKRESCTLVLLAFLRKHLFHD